MAFFLHEKGIVCWNEKMPDGFVELVAGDAPDFKKKSQLFTYFDRKDDENIYFASHIVKEDGMTKFKFDKIKINFNEYVIKNQYYETEYLEKVKSYGYDYAEKSIILLTRPTSKRKTPSKKIKIVDLDNDGNKVLLNMKV
jgi:hypothetical protein